MMCRDGHDAYPLAAMVLASALLASPLGAQTTRPDTVVSSARAPRVTYVPKTSRADTLRGSYTTPGRAWWDVGVLRPARRRQPGRQQHPRLERASPTACSAPAREMQIDLQVPLEVDSMVQDGQRAHVPARRQRVLRDARRAAAPRARTKTITVYYHGKPQVARERRRGTAASSGRRDSLGRPWIVDGRPGPGRERVVAEQGHPGRRAGQPARRASPCPIR